MQSNAVAIAQSLKTEALRLGFAQCGVARADTFDGQVQLSSWLDKSHHGSMTWMESRSRERSAPRNLWPDARSIIAIGMQYARETDKNTHQNPPDCGEISIYARGSDYHDVLKRNLKTLARWLVAQAGGDVKVFVDTAPVMEKPLAQLAGLGWQGKHTNIVSRLAGNWLFLGCIMTTLDLEPDAPHEDRCGACTACQRACPTDAFPAPYQLDARRCISYLTIEHKGLIPLEFREAIGNRIYGCDDCLAVCPWNKFAAAARVNMAFYPRAELAAPALADLLDLDDKSFRRIFSGSPIKRIGRDRFVRNCAIAAGNSGNPRLTTILQTLTQDRDPAVADAAKWALSRLANPAKGAA